MTNEAKNEAKLREYLRRATAELNKAHRRLGEVEARGREPIAIVGVACRYPGGVSSAQALWQLVRDGRDGISGFPADRGWDLERLYDPDPDHPGTSYTREGGFLADAAEFDPEFFGISPREALATDPQQRLLLEASWEALEDAGIDPTALSGTPTGVFAGISSQDYATAAVAREVEGYLSTGGLNSVVSGRVAFTLGLEGPAITVDTACSSSLVAMHLAAQALRGGECSLALAGGVTVISTPGAFVEFSRQRGLAADGRCKSFADGADGTGFSEGAGVLVLERLSAAERNGHPIHAVIRGSAVNQDGASNGLTAPNGPSQERVIRQALANARLTPGDVDAVEAHGTGTTLGDPIEAGALLATYGQEREQGRPLKLGSIKSNIGHTQAAAGAAGVIKMVMAMREGILPKTLHVDRPSSEVDWGAGEVELLTAAEPWESNGRPRRAGVSSFGISGTNAHLILEQAELTGERADGECVPEQGASVGAKPLSGPLPFVLSAKSEPALAEQAARLGAHIEANPELSPADLAYSLATTRATLDQRAALVAEDRNELLAGLGALALGERHPAMARATAHASQPPVFLFPGQGAQHAQMALALLEHSPSFATHIEHCEEALSPHVDWSLGEVLREEQGAWLERLDVVQPALFATMVSLARLWEELGVRPGVVLGHSQGEIAAAHIAGGLSLQDATLVVSRRAQAMAKIAGRGAMLSVSVPAAEIAPLLEPYGERLSLAAINGPASLALSGEPEALAELAGALAADGVRTREIAVDYAAHSTQIEDLEEELLEAFAPISPQSGEVPFHSTVSGEPIDTAELDAAYWYRNLRRTVLLEPVLRALLEQGQRTVIEIGPHPVLAFAVNETIEQSLDDLTQASVLGTLRREEGGPRRFCLSLAEAHANGAEVDWEAHFAGSGAKRVPLPTYPFQRQRYWLKNSAGGGDPTSSGQLPADHPLLGAIVEDPRGEGLTLTGRISLASHPWIADHALAGTVLLPGTALLEMALRAGAQVGAETLAELTLQAPLVIPEQGSIALQVVLEAPDEAGERGVSIHSRPDSGDAEGAEEAEWTCHAQGVLSSASAEAAEPIGEWPPVGAEPLAVDDLYERLADRGLECGPAFQGVGAAWRQGEAIYAEVSLAEELQGEAGRFAVHPALLAAVLCSTELSPGRLAEGSAVGLPFAWTDVVVWAGGATDLRVRVGPDRGSGVALALDDPNGAPVARVGSLIAREASSEQMLAAGHRARPLHGLDWVELQLETGATPGAAEVTTWRCDPDRDAVDAPAAARAALEGALDQMRGWLAEERPAEDRFAVLTRDAVASSPGGVPDPVAASLWGLLRAAQLERPESFVLIDSDGADASEAALGAALATGEPQLALREGRAFVPRVVRLGAEAAGADGERPTGLDPEATVLVTGGTGGLGVLIARHLVSEHGVRHLLLASRRGEDAEGTAELRSELSALGAEVRIEACDVSDRAQLEDLIGSVAGDHPLGGVVHAAGVGGRGLVEQIDREQIESLFAPKVDAAWHLHELTAGLDLPLFALFSSVSAVVGCHGLGTYAAANAFLDALAQLRRAQGLAASSMAWGVWGEAGGMAEAVGGADLARLAPPGTAPMPNAEGLALFDAALASPRPLTLPIHLDRAQLRTRIEAGTLPPVLHGLVNSRAPRRLAASGALAERLAPLPAGEREAVVLDLVRSEAAAVLGHVSGEAVEPTRAFRDQGFDSLAAVELRNRLVAGTGLGLTATVVFDHPSPRALVKHLIAKVMGEEQRQLVVRAQATEEPIAIVGMACRYPGGASSPGELWKLVAGGRDGIAEFPADRGWNLERLYHPDPDHPGTSYAREGGFLGDATCFDAEFFGMGTREALSTEPQQRLLLETAWEALESARIDPGSMQGSETGVFAGALKGDYAGIAPEVEGYVMVGSNTSVIAGRIAYTLGLEGPAMTVDTACSSSLVATHLAAQALRAGECSLALAGGVTVMGTPLVFTEFSRQRGLAPDGRCKSFAEAADGAGFSEGVGVLVLERLSEAQANGHPILATIRGSAVNQDGASNGLTAPNGPSQERVIRQALANARLTTSDIDAVEAHGTGTTLGDPIEAGALLATYGQDRERPLKLGSLKSNIGHPQAAAGVAGVIKTVMAMREGVLPKTLHVDAPSSKVDWEAGKIELLIEAEPWERNGAPRRAGVSSFGVSGTNAHLILEEAPEPAPEAAEEGTPQPLPGRLPFVLSAKTEEALKAQASRLAAHLEDHPELDPADLAYSLATTRSAFEQRAVAVGEGREELAAGLFALARGKEAPGLVRARARSSQGPVFLFPGQGAQRAQMTLGLLEGSPSFARHIERCEAALDPHVEWSLGEVLRDEQGAWLDRLDIVQPALFAVMVSLAELWRECGVSPAAVLGHSQGEIAAAHIAGGLSLGDAALIVARRAQAMARIAGRGAMLSVSLPAAEIAPRLEPYGERISVAAINGPASLALSGEPEALGELEEALTEEGVRAQKIAVDYAAHSAQIDDLEEELLEAFAPISPQSGELPFHSTVTGELLDTAELGPSYWYRNLRQTVLLEPVLRSLLEQGQRTLIEIGPHPVLAFAATETIEETLDDPEQATVLGTLRREEEGPERFVLSLAGAHAAGVPVDWDAFFKGAGAKRVPLPTYPFQRQRYWLSAGEGAGDPGSIGQAPADHPLLGAVIEDPQGDGLTLTGRISLATHPWLADHAAAGVVLLPGTAFLELALRAGQEVGCATVAELTLQAPLILPEQGAVQIQVAVTGRGEDGSREISIHSRPAPGDGEGEAAEWTCHAGGTLSPQPPGHPEPLDSWPPQGAEPMETEFLYDRLAEAGFEYGPAFQGLGAAWRRGAELFAEVSLAPEQAPEAQRFGLHPALLDAALHTVGLSALQDGEIGQLCLPFSWQGVSLLGGPAELRVRLNTEGEGISLSLADGQGTPIGEVDSLIVREVDPARLGGQKRPHDGLLGIEWQALSLPESGPEVPTERWRCEPAAADDAALAARETAAIALERVQAWIAEEPQAARLAILTRGALATGAAESPDPALASAWGLLRSAQSEHPGRFVLIDTDGTEASEEALAGALAIEDEPQLALREGVALVPRIVGAPASGEGGAGARPLDPGRTVLISGGTGSLGALVARHLVEAHGARHLLLASRSGAKADGAKQLKAELEELGAKVKLAACDVSDRTALEALLAKIPKRHPLGAVIHAAGALEDSTIEGLNPGRLEGVFAPKANAAFHLHELTRDCDLSAFVMFSAAAGVLGAPGQGNYAAANAFLDALAQTRHAEGLPATSIAWGLWRAESEMTAQLTEADLARLERSGIVALSDEQGLALFDEALRVDRSEVLGLGLKRSSLRALAASGALPPLMRALVRAPARRPAPSALAARLATLPEAEREAAALGLVRAEVAAVLGRGSAEEVDPGKAFKDFGFDSLAAVELRNRLNAATGLRLAATAVFDHPNATALARQLLAEATNGGLAKPVAVRATATEEPIAIVGMACRYPGGASSPGELWKLVAGGRDGIAEFPADRGWNLERLYHPDPDHPGTSYAREGGFLAEMADFDAEFFGISPREALAADPQQRLLLEACWEALEDAGVDPDALRGSQAGVFAGVMYQDYATGVAAIPDGLEGYLAAGAPSSVVSGRIAYTLGLEGPAITIDTACSSSLVATHLAAQALRTGECSLALAGGVTVLSTPGVFVGLSRQRGLAPDGRCKSFAEAADGAGFSEGVGVLVLERLSEAQANGHPILATIRGSAVNQDGASNGLTAPNGPSQERVIRQALANARLDY